MMKSDHIFVTGGTGLLGSHILRFLVHRGYQNISALKRVSSNMSLVDDIINHINWIEGDVRDVSYWSEIKPIDFIIHTAAIVSFRNADIDQMMDVNISGTANMVNLALHHDIKKFIHISSVAAIGKSRKTSEISESVEWEGAYKNSDYAVSKHFAEREVWRGQAEGLDVFILNPSIILGAGFWQNGSVAIVHNVYKGLPFYPQGSNGFVDVRDVAHAAVLGIENTIKNDRFILNGFNITFEELFTQLAQELDVKAPKRPLPDFLAALFYRYEQLKAFISRKRPIITKETLKSSRSKTSYINDKSKEILKMKYTSKDKTIKDISTSYLDAKRKNRDFSILQI